MGSLCETLALEFVKQRAASQNVTRWHDANTMTQSLMTSLLEIVYIDMCKQEYMHYPGRLVSRSMRLQWLAAESSREVLLALKPFTMISIYLSIYVYMVTPLP